MVEVRVVVALVGAGGVALMVVMVAVLAVLVTVVVVVVVLGVGGVVLLWGKVWASSDAVDRGQAAGSAARG